MPNAAVLNATPLLFMQQDLNSTAAASYTCFVSGAGCPELVSTTEQSQSANK